MSSGQILANHTDETTLQIDNYIIENWIEFRKRV